MPEQWLTYRQLGEVWNTTPEAARARSRRAHYERRTNEHGITEVLVNVDANAAALYPEGPSWIRDLEPGDHGLDTSGETSPQSLQVLEEQVAALRWECRRAEKQVELLQRHIEAEIEQRAHLMSVLMRRGGKHSGRGLISYLLFWRRSGRMPGHEAVQATAATPHMLRSAPVVKPDSGANTPDVRRSDPVIRPN